MRVCVAASCLSSSSDKVKAALDAAVKASPEPHRCKITGVGCLGLCKEGPLVTVDDDKVLYRNVTPDDAAEIVASIDGPPVTRLCVVPQASV